MPVSTVAVQCLSVQLQCSACQCSCSAVPVSTVAVQCLSVQLQCSTSQYSCSAVPVSTLAVQNANFSGAERSDSWPLRPDKIHRVKLRLWPTPSADPDSVLIRQNFQRCQAQRCPELVQMVPLSMLHRACQAPRAPATSRADAIVGTRDLLDLYSGRSRQISQSRLFSLVDQIFSQSTQLFQLCRLTSFLLHEPGHFVCSLLQICCLLRLFRFLLFQKLFLLIKHDIQPSPQGGLDISDQSSGQTPWPRPFVSQKGKSFHTESQNPEATIIWLLVLCVFSGWQLLVGQQNWQNCFSTSPALRMLIFLRIQIVHSADSTKKDHHQSPMYTGVCSKDWYKHSTSIGNHRLAMLPHRRKSSLRASQIFQSYFRVRQTMHKQWV